MRIFLLVLGGILGVIGVIFLLQGVGVIGGSFMSRQATWAIIGAVGILIGVWLIRAGFRWEPAPPLDESDS